MGARYSARDLSERKKACEETTIKPMRAGKRRWLRRKEGRRREEEGGGGGGGGGGAGEL